jgi:glucosamine--fructose-6-phosphate aminotransferase (isomerizing)
VKSLGNFPDPFAQEIAGQPDALRRAAAGLADQRDALGRLFEISSRSTPIFTGMGSSYDACYPAVTELARAGRAVVHVGAAELLHFRMRILDRTSLVVAVSQSGESAEVVRLARALPEADRPTVVAITNGTQSALASLADLVLDTRAGEETGPSTMTFAASLVALAGVAATLVGTPGPEAASQLVDDAEAAASMLDRLLADRSLPQELADWLGPRDSIVLLARGPARAAAEMGALTLKEAVGMPAESLEAAQFRHGPLELAGPDLAAIVFATEPETAELDLALGAELVAAGAAVLVVTRDAVAFAGATQIEIGPLTRTIAPAVSILPVQILAWQLAILRGRVPGAYVRASKVTTHE